MLYSWSFENTVGAHLLNDLQGAPYEVSYWRELSDEVDFVVRAGGSVWAIGARAAGRRAWRRSLPSCAAIRALAR